MATTIDKDIRKFGKTPDVDAEGNIYGKGLMPPVLSSTASGAITQAVAANAPDATGVDSGTLFFIDLDAQTVALPNHTSDAPATYKFVVVKDVVDTFRVSATEVNGLGATGTKIDLTEGKVGDYVVVQIVLDEANIAEAVGKWALSP